jgi:hypothetical protein
VGDGLPQVLRRPLGGEQLEVEGELQFIVAEVLRQAGVVGHPDLTHRHGPRVLVEHPTDAAVHRVDAVLVETEVAGAVVVE